MYIYCTIVYIFVNKTIIIYHSFLCWTG